MINLTYVFLKREGSFTFNQPPSESGYRKIIIQEQGADLIQTALRSWISEEDEIVEIPETIEVLISERLLNIHRRVHNQYDRAYKDVLDMEYLILAKDVVDTGSSYTMNRYPGPRRAVIDFNAKVYNPLIEAGLSSDVIMRSTSDLHVVILVMVSDDPERKALSDLVERYLRVENRDYERAQIMEDHRNISPYSFRPMRANSNLFSARNQPQPATRTIFNDILTPSLLQIFQNGNLANSSSNSFGNMSSIFNTTRDGGTGITGGSRLSDFLQNIIDDDSKREDRLYNIRGSLGMGDAMPRPFPASPDPQTTISSFLAGEGDGDLEVTYALTPGSTIPRPINADIIPSSLYHSSVFGDLMHYTNLLLSVNEMPLDLANSVDIASLMEPVRVTVNQDGMTRFLSYYEYGDGSEREKELKVDDQTNCAICLSEYEKRERVCYLNTCHHLFHEDCIKKWLSEFNHKCPVCRMSADPTKNESKGSQ